MKPRILKFALIFTIFSCTSDKTGLTTGSITFHFQNQENGLPAVYNSMQYTNAAGNKYEITNIQWFISDLSFIDNEGNVTPASSDNVIHYIDSDLPATQSWTIHGINPGDYKEIMFVFGIKGEKNIPNLFTDPPESNMMWPYPMGGDFGGYHYMKFNGFWMNTSGQRTPFNCHLGVGQIYDSAGNVTGYVQNWFEVFLPKSSFTMPVNGSIEANIDMNVNSWFDTPHIFNWNNISGGAIMNDSNSFEMNVSGGAIMNNQDAMGQIRDNGSDVFTLEFLNKGSGT